MFPTLDHLYQYFNRERIIRRFLILYTKLQRWFSTINIDESTLFSIYIGLTIGICVVTFLIFFPGEPTTDYEISTEEEALEAVQRKLYKKKKFVIEDSDDDDDKKKKKFVIEDSDDDDDKKKKKKREKKNQKETNTMTEEPDKVRVGGKKKSSSSSTRDVDDETLRRLEKFENIKEERNKEMDQEAEMFLEEMKKKGMTEDKMKEMVPEYLSVDDLKQNSNKPW